MISRRCPETFEDLGLPGQDPQGWVTWYATDGHVFIEVDGLVMDTVHGPRAVTTQRCSVHRPRGGRPARKCSGN